MTVLSNRNLWPLFWLYVLIVFCGLANLFSGHIYEFIITYAPVILVILHSFRTLSVKRGMALVFLAGFVGFIAEAVSLNYGTLFGGSYSYKAGSTIWGAPISIIAFWSIFIYLGYWFVTSFLYWLGKSKPNVKLGNLKLLGLLVLADGLAVTAIDLLMDPIEVKAGVWQWLNGGSYFGVPLGNFIGWFGVTITVTGTFRLFEYYRFREQRNTNMILLPVLGYLLVGINFVLGALKYDLTWLALIGTITIIAPSLVNLFLYRRYIKSK